MYLLGFIGSGEKAGRESEMVLNKILCGLPVQYPLKSKPRINEQERSETDHLLKAVIKHWEALKNTSPEGLRESFLLREGKLVKMDNRWILQVSRKSHDILLDTLPWGISVVKLKWMDHTIHVEW